MSRRLSTKAGQVQTLSGKGVFADLAWRPARHEVATWAQSIEVERREPAEGRNAPASDAVRPDGGVLD